MSEEGYDPQNKLEMLLSEYFEAVSVLSDAIKNNIKKDNKIDNKTILALNNVIIAANNIDFLEEKLTASKLKLN